MKLAICIFSGFTETESESTGMDATHRWLDDLYKTHPDVWVYDVRTWKHDTDGFAALLQRDGITHAIVLGYSHGAGYASPRFCKAALKRGIKIPLVCLCDPVYRPQWLPRWTLAQVLSFRALIPRSAVITFPAGVQTISGIRQHNNIPQGHKVRLGDGEPFDMVLVNRPDIIHGTIDNCPEWHSLVRAEVLLTVNSLLA